MAARMFVWPRYVLEVDGRRVTLPPTAGAAVSRLFWHAQRAPGHFIQTDSLVEAAYFDDEDGGPLTATCCIRVSIHRVREILRRLGVEIEGYRGRGHSGYRLHLPTTRKGDVHDDG